MEFLWQADIGPLSIEETKGNPTFGLIFDGETLSGDSSVIHFGIPILLPLSIGLIHFCSLWDGRSYIPNADISCSFVGVSPSFGLSVNDRGVGKTGGPGSLVGVSIGCPLIGVIPLRPSHGLLAGFGSFDPSGLFILLNGLLILKVSTSSFDSRPLLPPLLKTMLVECITSILLFLSIKKLSM